MPQTIKRFLVAVLVLGAAAVALPTAGQARIVEMGRIDEGVVPSCPGEPCRAVARTSGFQKRIGGESDLYTVPANGRIVAWSAMLAEPTQDQIDFFEERLGGPASAGVTVFRMSKKKKERGIGTVIGESGVQELTDFMGQTVQFPMANTIRVRKGDRVALTVPTWAPMLALSSDSSTVWRSTRTKEDCDDPTAPSAIEDLGAKSAFGCAYRAAQMTYTVTLITQPKANKPSKTDEDEADAEGARRSR